MRPLAALALVLAACGSPDRSPPPAAHDAHSANLRRGPDALVLRLPREGGLARVHAYPAVDSVVWTSGDAAPPVDQVLGFDAEAGLVSFLDRAGTPGHIDLRLGDVRRAARRLKLTSATSADGYAVFGVAGDGSVVRYTPTGNWSFKPPRPARAAFPQPDGSLIVLAGAPRESVLWKVFPPETELLDTAAVPDVQRTLRTQVGDRLYFAVDGGGLTGVRTRTLDVVVRDVPLQGPVEALVATPSGDRVYVLTKDTKGVRVYDRYRERIAATIELPARPADLRMDPVGRYLLVRAAEADSAWVVAIGTDRLLGAVPTAWRADLPFVGLDGSIVTAVGGDAALVDGSTLRVTHRVPGGSGDFWYPFRWSGFRPVQDSTAGPAASGSTGPDSGLANADTSSANAAAGAAPGDSGSARADSVPRPSTGGYIVSFAALLSEERARETAAQIRVGDERPRVQPTPRDGSMIYRVILGPYPDREHAERVGRASGQPYWVYEAQP
ncbi:MAG: SPOR domain-containing protein [Gemmatimonadaceae bacterium]